MSLVVLFVLLLGSILIISLVFLFNVFQLLLKGLHGILDLLHFLKLCNFFLFTGDHFLQFSNSLVLSLNWGLLWNNLLMRLYSRLNSFRYNGI